VRPTSGQYLRELQLLGSFRMHSSLPRPQSVIPNQAAVAKSAAADGTQRLENGSSGEGRVGAPASTANTHSKCEITPGVRPRSPAREAKRRRWLQQRNEALGGQISAVAAEPMVDIISLRMLPSGAACHVVGEDRSVGTQQVAPQWLGATEQGLMEVQQRKGWMLCEPVSGLEWTRGVL